MTNQEAWIGRPRDATPRWNARQISLGPLQAITHPASLTKRNMTRHAAYCRKTAKGLGSAAESAEGSAPYDTSQSADRVLHKLRCQSLAATSAKLTTWRSTSMWTSWTSSTSSTSSRICDHDKFWELWYMITIRVMIIHHAVGKVNSWLQIAPFIAMKYGYSHSSE